MEKEEKEEKEELEEHFSESPKSVKFLMGDKVVETAKSV